MTYRFYLLPPSAMASVAPLPEGYRFVTYSFANVGKPPSWVPRWPNIIWWGFHRLGLFRNRRSFIGGALYQGQLVARILVSAGWYRFPDFVGNDLQIGDVWTDPQHRGRRLAGALIALVSERRAAGAGRLWYIVDETNVPSISVIERAGFTHLSNGQLTRPLGLRVIGQYRLDRAH